MSKQITRTQIVSLSGLEELAIGSRPDMPNSDDDFGDDYEESLLGTDPVHWSEEVELPYRVVEVFSDRIETEVKKITREEKAETDDSDVDDVYSDIDNSITLAKPRDLLYPAIGSPEFVDKSASLTLKFSVLYGIIDGVSIESINNPSDFHTWNWDEVSLDDMYTDSLGRSILNCSVTLPSSVQPGLYNLSVVKDGTTYLAQHSVQILENFKSSFKYIQLTDVHIGTAWEPEVHGERVGNFMSIIHRINIVEKSDFVIITGDLTDSGDLEEIMYFKACLLNLDVPVFLTPGNHDHGTSGGFGSIDYYNDYLNPLFDSGSEGDYDDYSFNYGDYHFIGFDSGSVDTFGSLSKPAPALTGLTTPQLDWMKADYTTHDNKLKRTFIFTHGPIVGHGGGATHDRYSIIEGTPVIVEDRDKPFVEWVNEAGMTVEAVFVGHTHENHLYHHVDATNYNDPGDYYKEGYTPTATIPLYYGDPTFYLETDTACNEYSYS